MTAAIVLQLAGEGRLGLDDPIGDNLPGLLPYEQDPTVRQLLQQREQRAIAPGGFSRPVRFLVSPRPAGTPPSVARALCPGSQR